MAFVQYSGLVTLTSFQCEIDLNETLRQWYVESDKCLVKKQHPFVTVAELCSLDCRLSGIFLF